MSVPGSNIFNMASQVIALQVLSYIPYISRTKKSTGTLVPNYGPAKSVRASLQPVPRSLMQFLGLDMQKSYVNIYIAQEVVDVQRDVSGDKFKYGATNYQALSITPWGVIDGWNAVLAVRIP